MTPFPNKVTGTRSYNFKVSFLGGRENSTQDSEQTSLDTVTDPRSDGSWEFPGGQWLGVQGFSAVAQVQTQV